MINHSKSKQQRFWNKWKGSGAIGRIDNYARYPGLKDKLPGLNTLSYSTHGHKTGVEEYVNLMEKVDLTQLKVGDVIWINEELNPSTGKVYGYEKQVITGVNPIRFHQASIENCNWNNTLGENEHLYTVNNPQGVLNCLKKDRFMLIYSPFVDIDKLIESLETKLL